MRTILKHELWEKHKILKYADYYFDLDQMNNDDLGFTCPYLLSNPTLLESGKDKAYLICYGTKLYSLFFQSFIIK